MTLPNLYLVGAPKAGTTSVASWLGQHPEVYWSIPKEPFFWASDVPSHRAHYGFESLQSYEQLFDSDEAAAARIRAEGSTTYLYSRRAVPDILAAVPDAKFVVCVREPGDLLVSYHRTQVIALNEDEEDFARAWWRSLQGAPSSARPIDPLLIDYPRIGALGAAVARLSAQVPADQLHVILFEDLVNNPEQTYRRARDFLGIDPTYVPDLTAQNASNKAPRSALVRRVTHRPPSWMAPMVARARHWSRTSTLPGVQRMKGVLWSPSARPSADPVVLAEVRRHFRDDVALLETVIQRDLTAWRGA